METKYISYPHTLNRGELPETVAAIGFFDGVHKGHQTLIKEAVQEAKQTGRKSAVISFHPHPSVVLKKDAEKVEYITTVKEKAEMFETLGVDFLYIITFNKELSLLSPQTFIDHFIVELNIQHLVAGFDYSFGHKGAGNMQNITEYSQGRFTTKEMEQYSYQNEKISSTRIRKLLAAGDVSEVAPLLGRTYNVSGIVIHGDKRGRELGYPTANIEVSDEKLLPKQGIYAVTIDVKGKIYQGMASFGVNPTFIEGRANPLLETYIFDFAEDIYEEAVQVYFHQFIREEQKFAGKEEIIAALERDESKVKEHFSK